MLAGVLFSVAANARARGCWCRTAAPKIGQLAVFPAPGWKRHFRFVAKAGRSYAVMLENLTSPDQQAAIGVSEVTDGCGEGDARVYLKHDVSDFRV